MNDFDKPVAKAATDAEILGALQGLKLTQSELRDGTGSGMALAFFRAYYEKLPEDVARRLTEIDRETVNKITSATGSILTGTAMERLVAKIAGDAAWAQVIRAANSYREKLNFDPLGPDGWPAQGQNS